MFSRKYLIIYLAILALFIVHSVTRASGITLQVDCVERPADSGAVRVWLGFTLADDTASLNSAFVGAESDGSGLSPGFGGHVGNVMPAGTYARALSVEFPAAGYDVTWSVWDTSTDAHLIINYDTTGPECVTGQPDGGLDSITLWDVSGERFEWEIWDGYTWNKIEGVITPAESAGGRSFTRLTLGADNGNVSADNYRVFAVER